MPEALAGIRVLDLSRLLPGPFCSMLLADMGADVIKVEAPKVGDYIRWWPPLVGNNSGFHVVLNRNKRSVTLNLKTERGRDLFRTLAANADVILEGFRPGVMDRLGLGYQSLKEANPGLIYCAVSGYGQEGPRAQRAGHDINYLAVNGVLSYCGRNRRPCLPGVQIADLGGGALLAAFSISTALYAREKLGEGQYIDIAMTDGAFTWNCLRWGKYLGDGEVPSPGDDFLNHGYACYNIYRTRDDRYMSLGALEPQFWKAFCRAVGHSNWDRPDYFQPGPHQNKLQRELEELFATRTQAEWQELFADIDCCCEPVLDLDEVMNDEQMKARQMVVELVHQQWGAYRQIGIAPKFSLTPGKLRSHAPELGEHTQEVLTELGIEDDEIERLRNEQVI